MARLALVAEADIAAKRVGERLLHQGLITDDQLRIALHEQARCGKMLGAILVELGFVESRALAQLLAERAGFPSIDLKVTPPDPVLLLEFPKEVARRCRAVPVGQKDGVIEVAFADPYDLMAIDEVRRHIPPGLELAPLVAADDAIADALSLSADADDVFGDILRAMDAGDDAGKAGGKKQAEGWTHPVVRLVDKILDEAARRGASDIHLEPENTYVRLRFRIDGVLHQICMLHRAHWPEISHRVKIMSGLNIADTRSLQDGRFDRVIGGASVDFRVAVMPTVQGENIVIRVLDHRRALLPLDRLGFNGTALGALDRLLRRPEGIVLVTGPTGSGKTTSLYAMLTKIRSAEVNIMTLEEPVEYQFEMIRQTSIAEGRGFGFAEGVRGILRQAPDIIFIGEVRDPDTAQMALRAAMTGHQVFSTLHCNDALGALPRLIDLGLTPRMIAGNLCGVVAQRLVRKLCAACSILRPATDGERRLLKCALPPARAAGFAETQSAYLAPDTAAPMVGEAKGCPACFGTGRRGRMVISEILCVTPALDELIAADAPRSALKKQMRADGFQSMAEDGRAKVLAGEIALADLCRAVDLERGGLMPSYRYRAVNESGRVARGTATAVNEAELVQYLGQTRLELIDAREKKQPRERGHAFRSWRRVSARTLTLFCGQMSDLLRADAVFLDALDDLTGAMEPGPLPDALRDIGRALRHGSRISDAFARHPRLFPPVFIAILAAGEAGGDLTHAFERLSAYVESRARMNERLARALRYPLFLLAVASGVVTFMMAMVVPQIVGFLKSIDTQLPPATRLLIAVSELFASCWWMAALGVAAIAGAAIVSHRLSPRAALFLDGCVLKIPAVGPVTEKLMLARFAQSFAALVQSGMTIPESLRDARDTLGNRALEARLDSAARQIAAGRSLSAGMAEFFPPFALRLLRVGEQGARLTKSLGDIAAHYDREGADAAERMVGALEPALTLMIGGILAWVVLAVLGPIYSNLARISGGG